MTALIIVIAVSVLVALGVTWAVVRMRRERHAALPPPPEYYEALHELEGLKSGRLWGDVPGVDPGHRHSTD